MAVLPIEENADNVTYEAPPPPEEPLPQQDPQDLAAAHNKSDSDDDDQSTSSTASDADDRSDSDSDSNSDDDDDEELTSIVDERPKSPEDEYKIVTKLDTYGERTFSTMLTKCVISKKWVFAWMMYTNFQGAKKKFIKYLKVLESVQKKNEEKKKEREEKKRKAKEEKMEKKSEGSETPKKKSFSFWGDNADSSDDDDHSSNEDDDDEDDDYEKEEVYDNEYAKGKRYDWQTRSYVYDDLDKEFLRQNQEYREVQKDWYKVVREDGVIVDCIFNDPGPIKNADLIKEDDPYYEGNLKSAKELREEMKKEAKKEKEEAKKNEKNANEEKDDDDDEKDSEDEKDEKKNTENADSETAEPEQKDNEVTEEEEEEKEEKQEEEEQEEEEEEEIVIEKRTYLKDDKVEDQDYIFVYNIIYDQLSHWYGDDIRYEETFEKGYYGNATSEPYKVGCPMVDKYPEIKFNVPYKDSWTVTRYKTEILKTMNLDKRYKTDDIRLSDYWGNRRIAVLKDNKLLSACRLYDKNGILVEFKDKDGNFPEIETESSYGSSSSSSGYRSGYGSSYSYTAPAMEHPGLCGLRNLGNTCFMNSSLQCMSNTKPLRDFLLGEGWEAHINTDNPLGTGGKLTRAFQKLIHKMWRGTEGVVSPSDFKAKLGDFAPQFSGYQQHDSHELLSYLLDGLHEDLNLVKKKPYVEAPDYEGQPIEQWAKESWDRYLLRNRSVLVDLFMGQFKSTTQCPDCKKESVVCDTFSSISVPLPGYNTKKYEVYVHVPQVGRNLKINLTLNSYGAIKDLKKGVVAFLKEKGIYDEATVEKMMCAEVYNNSISKVFDDEEMLSEISSWYKPHCYCEDEREEGEVKMRVICATKSKYSYSSYFDKFGEPEFGNVKKETTYNRVCIDALKVILNDDNKGKFVELVKKYLNEKNETEEKVDGEATEEVNNEDNEKTEKVENNNDVIGEVIEKIENININNSNEEEEEKVDGETTEEANNEDTEKTEKVENNNDAIDDVIEKVKNININNSNEEEPEEEEAKEDLGEDLLDGVTNAEIVSVLGNMLKVYYGSNYGYKEGEIPEGEPVTLDTTKTLLLVFSSELKEAMSLESSSTASTAFEDLTTSGGDDESKDVTLDDCLKLFMERDQLGEEDQWYCPQCKEFKQAFRKMEVWKAPPLLVVNIKRFSFRNKYYRDKLETVVNFPIEGLDMGKYVLSKKDGEELIYDLYAVSNHFGSLGGGHYTAYAKNSELNEWYNFNDSSVSKVTNLSEIVSSAAYTLFYVKRGYSYSATGLSSSISSESLSGIDDESVNNVNIKKNVGNNDNNDVNDNNDNNDDDDDEELLEVL